MAGLRTAATEPKLTGISAVTLDGRAAWRVMWRLWRTTPRNGALKKDQGSSAKFWIGDGVTEQQAFEQARELAARVYRMPQLREAKMPKVDWESIGRIDQRAAQRIGTADFETARQMFGQGYKPGQVAAHLGIGRTTATRWRKLMQDQAQKSRQ